MSRFTTLLLQQLSKIVWLILMDAVLLPLALISAVLLRLGGVWDAALNPYWWIFVIPIIWILPIFTKLGLYRAALKYIDDQIVWTVFYGVSLAVLPTMATIGLVREVETVNKVVFGFAIAAALNAIQHATLINLLNFMMVSQYTMSTFQPSYSNSL